MQRPSKNVGFGSYPGKFGLMCGPHNERVCSMQRETGPLGNFNHSQNVEIYYVQKYFATEFTEKYIALATEIELFFVTLSHLQAWLLNHVSTKQPVIHPYIIYKNSVINL